MATTTFSGPIKAGTIKDTTGTTLGSDVKNVGFTVMAQSAAITQSTNCCCNRHCDSSQLTDFRGNCLRDNGIR
jgi:hypothetical protein